MNKKLAALGVSIGVLGGGAAGFLVTASSGAGAETVAPAQEESTDTTVASSTESQTGDAADDDRAEGRADRLGEVLAPLVEDGTITQAQADAVIDALVEAAPFGRDGDRGHGGPGGRGGPFGGAPLQEIVTALDLDLDEVMTALREGTTIAELAEQQGVDLQAVIDAAVAAAKEHLDEEVAEGDLTQAEADEHLQRLTEAITAFVEGDVSFPMGGWGGRGHGPFGGHHDGPESADDAAPTTTVG